MHHPASTYRIQLNKDFTFRDLRGILDYLELLGVSTVYAAPILTATPGSMHGYDVTDPDAVNPEIGTVDELRTLASLLKKKGMDWLQDIVPNHMAFGPQNGRLMDVLERGAHSEYYRYFDIQWEHPSKELDGKVMVPFLGNGPEECIDKGELKLAFSDQGFTIQYIDTHYPLSIPAYDHLITRDTQSSKHLQQLLRDTFGVFISNALSMSYPSWRSYRSGFLKDVAAMYGKQFNELVSVVNNDRDMLCRLLEKQYYLLTYWKRTEQEINYRRFFTVNSLICLRMEEETVFSDYHRFLHALWKEDLLQGFRIDHIDGLSDPSGYARRLRDLTRGDAYIVAEKILEAKEQLPERWPLQGTSGYEFLAHVSQLFTDRKGARKILAFYRALVPGVPPYRQLVLENKRLILEQHMAGEWNNLVSFFFELRLQSGYSREKLRQAFALVMLHIPVYRIYPEQIPVAGKDLEVLATTFEAAGTAATDVKPELMYLQSLFTGIPATAEEGERILRFLCRLMQFTGPLTAKGVEDTTFYVYNPLISHDEVGDAPSTLGISIQEFHQKMIVRQAETPLSLNATATHDTKRGEDARLRLNVLSEMPEAWEEKVRDWCSLNERFHAVVQEKVAPTINDEYFIYQSLIGGFPEDWTVTEEFIERIRSYWVKVAREAKVNSSWEHPDEAYENACRQFLEKILDPQHAFLDSFLPFVKKVARFAGLYSIGQTLLKITAPGIPDTYQGTELWDLSFVDPDNRRPVSYDVRAKYAESLVKKEKEGWDPLSSFLSLHQDEGVIKLWVTMKALTFRRLQNDLFIHGRYVPLTVSGKDTVAVAYARTAGERWVVVIVPLNVVAIAGEDHQQWRGVALKENAWNGTAVLLPDDAPKQWKNIFTGEVLTLGDRMPLGKVFEKFPLVLLESTAVVGVPHQQRRPV